MTRFKILMVTIVLIGSITGLWVARTAGQAIINPVPIIGKSPINVYAVKFLCGDLFPAPQGGTLQREGPVKPGDYQTAINIHNPNFQPVPFVKKAVLMFADLATFPTQEFEVPRPPGQLYAAKLESDWGMEIDCADIRKVLLTGILPQPSTPNLFIKGWVVIETPEKQSLDIVTAYTSHGFKPGTTAAGGTEPEGFSLEIERTTPTVVKFD